jgi:eukaryotic translation initiation factor 2-alpha kinase 4
MEDVVENRKMLREVTTVSRLYHRHIVRYYQAWLEGGSGSGAASDDDEEDESNDDSDEWTSEEDTQESSDWMLKANKGSGTAFVQRFL